MAMTGHHALVLDANSQTGSWTIQGDVKATGRLILPGLPTTPSGLPPGAVWNNHGTLSVAP